MSKATNTGGCCFWGPTRGFEVTPLIDRKPSSADSVRNITRDLAAFGSVPSPLSISIPALIQHAAKILWDNPLELEGMESEDDQLLFIETKLRALHVQGRIYSRSFGCNQRNDDLANAALTVDQLAKRRNLVEFEAAAKDYVDKLQAEFDNLSIGEKEENSFSNFHYASIRNRVGYSLHSPYQVSLQYNSGSSQVCITDTRRSLGNGGLKNCRPSIRHGGSTNPSVLLSSIESQYKRDVTDEGDFIIRLQKLGVPHLPQMLGIGSGSMAMKQYDKDLKNLPDSIFIKSPSNFRLVAHNISSSLAALHELGWIHGDVKKSNILLDVNERNEPVDAVLTDFGQRMNLKVQSYVTGHRTTATIISFESFFENKTSKASDVYALGLALLSVLFDKPPGSEFVPKNCRKHTLDRYVAAIVYEVGCTDFNKLQEAKSSFLKNSYSSNFEEFIATFPPEIAINFKKSTLVRDCLEDWQKYNTVVNHLRYLSWRKDLLEEKALYHFTRKVFSKITEREVDTLWRTSKKDRDFASAVDHFFENLPESPWKKYLATLYRSVHPNQDFRPTAKEFAEAFTN